MAIFPSTDARLTALRATAPVITFDDNDKFIFFSDCHRGDGSWQDDYDRNRVLHLHALNYYFERGFTYFELGDGDELFENKSFDDVRYTHSNIFHMMRQFYENGRFHMLYGNHDIMRRDASVVEKQLFSYYDVYAGDVQPLFPNIQVHEGLLLQHRQTGQTIFLFHGHQGDLMNDHLWRVAYFFVRYIWSRLQFMGWNDPTLPPLPYHEVGEVERKVMAWAEANQQMVICGHTHRSWFSKADETPYFNSGSCVHPRCITGLEIQNGAISLVKWDLAPELNAITGGGILTIQRTVLAGGAMPLQAIRFSHK